MFTEIKKYCFNPKIIQLCLLVLLVAITFGTGIAEAASGNAGDIGNNIAGNVDGLTNAAKAIAWFGGFVLVIVAIFLFAQMKKPGNQTGPMVPLLMLVCGIALLSIMAVVSMGSSTIFGSDETSEAMSELGL